MFLDHAPVQGGAEKSLLLLLRHMPVQKNRLHLAAPAGPLLVAAKKEGAGTHAVEFPRLRRSLQAPFDLLIKSAQLARLARAHRAGAIYANTVRTAFYGAVCAKMAGIRFVWHMRDFWLTESGDAAGRFDRTGKRWLCSAASLVLANSHSVRDSLPCPQKARVIYNGIDVAYFSMSTDGLEIKQAYGIPAHAPVLGTVGRLRPWKGHATFIQAMAEVAKKRPDAYYLIVGGASPEIQDGYLAGLARLAGDLGIGKHVIFTGHLDDIRPALRAMDIFIHAGEPEPFGLVNIEAMACEKPVIALGHGALPEIVRHGQDGLLVPPGDQMALAQAAVRLLENPTEMRRMGQSGAARVWTDFSASQTALKVAEALQEIGL